jgi:hypothetical protein
MTVGYSVQSAGNVALYEAEVASTIRDRGWTNDVIKIANGYSSALLYFYGKATYDVWVTGYNGCGCDFCSKLYHRK